MKGLLNGDVRAFDSFASRLGTILQSPVLLLKLLLSGCFIYLHSPQAVKVLLND